MLEEKIIREFLKGNDEVLEENYIDIVEVHEADKAKASNKRKQDLKHKRKSKLKQELISNTVVNLIFKDKPAREKKTYKKSASKKSRQASDVVNSSRGLYKKMYSDLDDKLKNQY